MSVSYSMLESPGGLCPGLATSRGEGGWACRRMSLPGHSTRGRQRSESGDCDRLIEGTYDAVSHQERSEEMAMSTARTHPLLFGAIADDLTGGLELASMLVARGVPTGYTIGPDAPIDGESLAHVVALKTRVAPREYAVQQTLKAADALIANGARQIFLKYCATFDSTPAGNIGPCAEALLTRLGANLTLFCPALCELERCVFQGHFFVGRQLLADSPKRYDPLTPMTESDITKILAAQSINQVGLLPHSVVDAGVGAIAEKLKAFSEEKVPLIVTDAIYERDLAAIAEAAADLPLMTGNSSVAAHFPPVWRKKGILTQKAVAPLPAVDGPAAVLAGSVASRTADQLAHFGRNHPVLTLDLSAAFAGADLVDKALRFAREHLAADRPIAIATTAAQDKVDALQKAHGRTEVAEVAERILASVAVALVQELGVRRLVVAGGETCGTVLKALGVDRLTVGSYQGLGESRAVALAPVRLALMLKSGKLGSLGVFSDVLEAMRRPAANEPILDHWPPRQG
jgi:3-dehydrotetronate 4-kinase